MSLLHDGTIGEFHDFTQENRERVYLFLRMLVASQRRHLLPSDIWDIYIQACQQQKHEPNDDILDRFAARAEEAVIDAPWIGFSIRPRIGWHYRLRVNTETLYIEEWRVADFLAYKERLVLGHEPDWVLEFDIDPFNREFPRLQETRSIGRGVEFLNRRLSSELFQGKSQRGELLLHFLRLHNYRGLQLMLDETVRTREDLLLGLQRADRLLGGIANDTPWQELAPRLKSLGFEPGWGSNVGRALDTMRLLSDILEAPEATILEHFLARIPMIFNLLIISPHGYFAQANVLGRPDTGGQVVYILDQVRALEREMCTRLEDAGLDIEPQIIVLTRLIPEAEGTTCNEPHEMILGTRNARILRVPFRSLTGEIVRFWISRFEVWPYLERFALESEQAVMAELNGRPDLIIGNYSDGNLVATLLAERLGVTQCNIAHALEKTKYLFSDLYWRDNDAQYHFATQYTADLIAMNAADFIVTSTFQEIAGTEDAIGQYESYESYTLPDLYRVTKGIDIFDPKFNIVSPGADPEIYFPYSDSARRLPGLQKEIESLIFGAPDQSSRGQIGQPELPILFTMARLDRIKNLTGLVEWFGRSERLRKQVNLLVIAGHVDASETEDQEEKEQIERMYSLFEEYQLDRDVRWLGVRLEKTLAGELYRYVADRRGGFVQPALFEAFGLTVIEAMSSGLPTFATRYGGPLEIIGHGESGFHIDPNHGDEAATLMADFFERCQKDPDYWMNISRATSERIENRYTWSRYAERMMTLSRVYGFWKYVTDLERSETRRYLEMFYALQYRASALAIPTRES